MCASTVRVGFERLVLLGVISEAQAVAGVDLAGVGLFHSGEQAQ